MLHWIPGYEGYEKVGDKVRAVPHRSYEGLDRKATALSRRFSEPVVPMNTVYFEGDDGLVGFVVPYDEEVSDLVAQEYGVRGIADDLPPYQQPGSCGPWCTGERTNKILFDKRLVDEGGLSEFVVPGEPRLSLVGRIDGLYAALEDTAPDLYGRADITMKDL